MYESAEAVVAEEMLRERADMPPAEVVEALVALRRGGDEEEAAKIGVVEEGVDTAWSYGEVWTSRDSVSWKVLFALSPP